MFVDELIFINDRLVLKVGIIFIWLIKNVGIVI